MDIHDSLYLFILAIIQGFTEVLPISSSGHLALVQRLFFPEKFRLASVIALHSGSLIAIAYWFRRDLSYLWRCFYNSWPLLKNPQQLYLTGPSEYRVSYFIILSLVPVAILGILLEPWANILFSGLANWVPAFLVMNGLVILATAHWTRGERKLDELVLKDYLFIGILQGFAVLPGISRLGLVLCAGLWRGLSWYEALRLTFILALPTIAGAIFLQLFGMRRFLAANIISSLFTGELFVLLLSILIVAGTSLLGLKKLTGSLLERRTLYFFGYYCCLLGAFSFTYIAVGF